MKSRRRHELKESTLAHELVQIRDFYRKYGNWIVTFLAAAVIIWLIAWYYRGRSSKRITDEMAQYALAVADLGDLDKQDGALDSLASLAEGTKDPLLAARAATDLGDVYCAKHMDAVRRDQAEAGRFHKEATYFYRLVIEEHSEYKVMVARAHLGLGALAQNSDNRAKAQSHYEKIASLVSPGSPLGLEARRQQAGMAGASSKPVRFATSLPATLPAATAPSSKPAT